MRRSRARLSLLDTLDEVLARGDVTALVFHPATYALVGFCHQGTLTIGPEFSLDEAMHIPWVLRDLAAARQAPWRCEIRPGQ